MRRLLADAWGTPRRRWALGAVALLVVGGGTALQPAPDVGARLCRAPLEAEHLPRKDRETGEIRDLHACVLRAEGRDIVVSEVRKWPRRGRIISLAEARRRFRSACLDGPGREYVVIGASASAETLFGSNGSERMLGLAGPDIIAGRLGNDCIDTGVGPDEANPGGGDDIVFGGTGNDRLVGGSGADQLDGGEGNDTILGGVGADRITGGPGNDSIRAGAGKDVVDGGPGDDTITAAHPELRQIDCGPGRDRVLVIRLNRTRVRNCEVLENA